MLNNNNDFTCYKYRVSNHIYQISFLSLLVLLLFFSLNINNLTIFGQKSDSEFNEQDDDINIVVAGDFYCNDQTEDTINNIISVNPELIITTGDHVKESPSASCWIEISKPIKDKMKIAIGNHDVEFANIFKQIVDYHNVKTPYYSHDFQNVHCISMSTEHPFEEGTKQYEFIKNDLEKTSTNSSIDWIIVHKHKPLYSTNQDKVEAEQLRDAYQQLFQQYDVDLVISSHNQYYERTYPILYNEEFEKQTSKKVEPKPIITNPSQSDYLNKDNGIIFLTVGTGGDELQDIIYKEDYYVIQKEKYGFLNLKLENDGKTLVSEFRTGDDDEDILDNFKLTKS